MKTLYLECYSGASGDMTVASLLDLGVVSSDYLRSALATLPLDGFSIDIHKTEKNGISALKFDVSDYINGHDHDHEHDHEHEHEHRHLAEILSIIESSDISAGAKKRAADIFTLLAEAEAKAHSCKPEEVHFHEVGAIDSIIDIVSAAVLLDAINPDRIICSEIYEGSGRVKCAHGEMPVPVPATANIFAMRNMRFRATDTQGELVTPTGAAILGSQAVFGEAPGGRLAHIGVGAGTMDFAHPNVMRAMIFESGSAKTDVVTVLEANIDDSTGEELALCADMLREIGVYDISFTPIFMKKGRPAYEMTVICENSVEEAAAELIFTHTSTIGLRKRQSERYVMSREIVDVETRYGKISVKVCSFNGVSKCRAEYESAKSAAERNGITLHEVMAEAEKAYMAGESRI